MNNLQKIVKKLSLILMGRGGLAFKRKKIRQSRSLNYNGLSRLEQSQNGQDNWIIEYFKDNKNTKTFVEFGAHDGKTNSNTYRLEKEYGWGGLLIEPIPNTYKKLTQNRHCHCIHACISRSPGTVQFMEVTGPACQLSGILDKFPQSHLRRIDKAIKSQGGDKVIHEIKSMKLEEALNEFNISQIEFLSIDTEGSEYDILKTFPFKNYNIEVIALENSYHGDFLIGGFSLLANIS